MDPAATDLIQQLDATALTGMQFAVWAELIGERAAVIDPDGTEHSFAKVNANANRLVRLLRGRGLAAGDAVALVCSNRAEFIEVLAATLRSGLRLTPVNWHLSAEEIAYIVQDCEAKAVIADARVPAMAEVMAQCPPMAAKLAVGGAIDGFEPYEAALASFDGADIDDPVLGNGMMYTSGTTGRPKGVYRANPVITPFDTHLGRAYEPGGSVQMCAGPAYHAAPLAFDIRAAMATGASLVFIDRWDSELVLKTISERKVTHFHLVPIMFQRLLALPAEVKARYPIDHVKFIIHGAAPCPPEVKRAMIDWFGPVLTEYYAGSEGGAGFFIDSHEWLRKPGSVGKSAMGPIHWVGPQAFRSVVHGCTTAMTPVGRDAHVSGPSMHGAATSRACGQRRMVGRSPSITDRFWSAAQAVQTMTVNGRSVAWRGEVTVRCPGRCSFRGRAAAPFRARPPAFFGGTAAAHRRRIAAAARHADPDHAGRRAGAGLRPAAPCQWRHPHQRASGRGGWTARTDCRRQ